MGVRSYIPHSVFCTPHSGNRAGWVGNPLAPGANEEPRTGEAGVPTEMPIASTPSRGKPGGDERILLVEDNGELREATGGLLAAYGYQVTAVESGEAALEVIDRGTPIDLVVSDVVMPGLSGKDVLDRIRERRADLPVLFISGYTDNVIFRHGLLAGELDFLEKPFAAARLTAKVREILDRPGKTSSAPTTQSSAR